MTIIDAHQHFWRLDRGDYRFPRPDDAVLYRNFLPDHLAPLLSSAGVATTILVQATDTIAETQYLLDIAENASFVGGVVGWWNPRASAADLEGLAEHWALVGVRAMLQGLDDIAFMLTPGTLAQLERLAEMDLAFDVLVAPQQLTTITELCRRVPALRVVVDHMGKPWRIPGQLDRWRTDMRELAGCANCSVKVSGYPFGNPPGRDEGLEVLVGVLRDAFGAGRLLWGSDWPVAEREGGYRMVIESMQEQFTGAERQAVFCSNAAAIYSVPRQKAKPTT